MSHFLLLSPLFLLTSQFSQYIHDPTELEQDISKMSQSIDQLSNLASCFNEHLCQALLQNPHDSHLKRHIQLNMTICVMKEWNPSYEKPPNCNENATNSCPGAFEVLESSSIATTTPSQTHPSPTVIPWDL